jgi:hypothetical protein
MDSEAFHCMLYCGCANVVALDRTGLIPLDIWYNSLDGRAASRTDTSIGIHNRVLRVRAVPGRNLSADTLICSWIVLAYNFKNYFYLVSENGLSSTRICVASRMRSGLHVAWFRIRYGSQG